MLQPHSSSSVESRLLSRTPVYLRQTLGLEDRTTKDCQFRKIHKEERLLKGTGAELGESLRGGGNLLGRAQEQGWEGAGVGGRGESRQGYHSPQRPRPCRVTV